MSPIGSAHFALSAGYASFNGNRIMLSPHKLGILLTHFLHTSRVAGFNCRQIMVPRPVTFYSLSRTKEKVFHKEAQLRQLDLPYCFQPLKEVRVNLLAVVDGLNLPAIMEEIFRFPELLKLRSADNNSSQFIDQAKLKDAILWITLVKDKYPLRFKLEMADGTSRQAVWTGPIRLLLSKTK